jgi:hypothetical protein
MKLSYIFASQNDLHIALKDSAETWRHNKVFYKDNFSYTHVRRRIHISNKILASLPEVKYNPAFDVDAHARILLSEWNAFNLITLKVED